MHLLELPMEFKNPQTNDIRLVMAEVDVSLVYIVHEHPADKKKSLVYLRVEPGRGMVINLGNKELLKKIKERVRLPGEDTFMYAKDPGEAEPCVICGGRKVFDHGVLKCESCGYSFKEDN